jgi:hypothetical protein
MSDVTCAQCGTVFAAERSTARFCSDMCRKRARRGTRPAKAGGEALAGPGAVEIHTRGELLDAQALDTAMGQAALTLAVRIDAGNEPGGIQSQMVARLGDVLATIKAQAPPVADPLTAIRARVAAKRAELG